MPFSIQSKIFPKLKALILQMMYQNILEGSGFTVKKWPNDSFPVQSEIFPKVMGSNFKSEVSKCSGRFRLYCREKIPKFSIYGHVFNSQKLTSIFDILENNLNSLFSISNHKNSNNFFYNNIL